MRPSSATPRGFGAKIVISGPLFSDDGEKMIGSLFLVEAPDRDEVEAFNRADPFTEAGIWGTRFDYGICTAPRLNRRRASADPIATPSDAEGAPAFAFRAFDF